MTPHSSPHSPRRAGRHFLQIPGPTNVPDRVLRAIDFPTMDHRGPEFATLGKEVLAGLKRVFKSTQGEVVIYPASGTGAFESAGARPRPSNSTGIWLPVPNLLSARRRSLMSRKMFHSSCAPRLTEADARNA